MQENPYAFKASALPPLEERALPAELSEAERFAIRQKHIAHEDSILGIGIVFILGGLLLCAVGIFGFVSPATAPPGGGQSHVQIFPQLPASIISFGMGAAQLVIGFFLQNFNKSVRIPAAVACIPWLFSLIGTLPSAYFIYLLLSRKGRYIFTDEYKELRKKTPGVYTKTSLVTLAVLGIFILGVLLLFAFA